MIIFCDKKQQFPGWPNLFISCNKNTGGPTSSEQVPQPHRPCCSIFSSICMTQQERTKNTLLVSAPGPQLFLYLYGQAWYLEHWLCLQDYITCFSGHFELVNIIFDNGKRCIFGWPSREIVLYKIKYLRSSVALGFVNVHVILKIHREIRIDTCLLNFIVSIYIRCLRQQTSMWETVCMCSNILQQASKLVKQSVFCWITHVLALFEHLSVCLSTLLLVCCHCPLTQVSRISSGLQERSYAMVLHPWKPHCVSRIDV